MIIDFTRDEEAKYQGLLTSKEVQSFLSEPAENRSRPSSKSSDRKVKTAASDKSKKKKGMTTLSEKLTMLKLNSKLFRIKNNFKKIVGSRVFLKKKIKS
jgi:hypothetical protein